MTGVHSINFSKDYIVLPYSEEAKHENVGYRYKRTGQVYDERSQKLWQKDYVVKPYHSFITLDYRQFVLVVRDVKFRLVLTLPYQVHKLDSTHFFIVIRGAAPLGSYGNLFFRQDQPHIDLFVFFSVFFSAFFLFLALCVLAWKVKQASDIRRARYMHAIHMEHMASRPFGRALIYFGHDDYDDDYVVALPPKQTGYSKQGARSLPKDLEAVQMVEERNLQVHPVALEPTDDGIAAVGTVLLHLPGGICAPVKLCLGSALVTMRVMFPIGQHPKCNIRGRSVRSHSYA